MLPLGNGVLGMLVYQVSDKFTYLQLFVPEKLLFDCVALMQTVVGCELNSDLLC